MRFSKKTGNLKVHVVSGTYVVFLAFNLPEELLQGFKGFSIHRKDPKDNTADYLQGMKAFKATDPGFPPGSGYSSNEHPIQSFQWGDYSAKPGREYTYTITALRGEPDNLKPFEKVVIEVSTESPESGTHDIYFNRGTAASQEYMKRFGNLSPEKVVPPERAFEWLSRGLYEALTEYITSCKPGVHSLRIAAYEFNYEPLLKIIRDTILVKGVDIQIVYDKRKDKPGEKNAELVENLGLSPYATPRVQGKSYISHNKFIVKLENDIPVSVWTGGTNFSDGGIFGHSNVAHVVEEPSIAEVYLSYWELLKADLPGSKMKKEVEKITPALTQMPSVGTSVIASPRNSLDMLEYYASLAKGAKEGLFMTFAFGINEMFKEVYRNAEAPLRFALLEKPTRPMSDKTEEDRRKKAEELNKIQLLRNKVENIFSIGNMITTGELDGWLEERLTGLNRNVNYVHNKFALIDPLGKDPIIIAGSANFSNASTTDNDENMLVIRGNTRVADIYMGEFMRLFKHFSFRESLTFRDANTKPKPLRVDDWWKMHFGSTSESARRKYFAREKD
jgi:phosphatidylserine/phosphatidylglycerophosphate/cardiolipin synthase-like enzyme